jgi:hypothetical protein
VITVFAECRVDISAVFTVLQRLVADRLKQGQQLPRAAAGKPDPTPRLRLLFEFGLHSARTHLCEGTFGRKAAFLKVFVEAIVQLAIN